MVDAGVTGEEPVVRWARERLAEGKSREARRAVEELAARSTDPDTLASVAEFFLGIDDVDAAVRCGRRATMLAPDSARAWQVLASSYKKRKRRAKAVAAARRAVALDPNAVESLLVLAEVLYTPGSARRRDEASQVLATAAAVAPHDPRPREADRALEHRSRAFWKGMLVTGLVLCAIRLPVRYLPLNARVVADSVFLALMAVGSALGVRSALRSRGQTLRERMRTRRARAREDDVRDDDDLIDTARGWIPSWPLVTLLALIAHVMAAAIGAPFPRWTLVFPVAGAAAYGSAVWWWTRWWFGPGVVRRVVRLSAPLRHQLALAAGLIAGGVALLATGVHAPALWAVTALALISWGIGGSLYLMERSQRL